MASEFTNFLLVMFCILASTASMHLIEPDFKINSPKAMTRLVTQLLSEKSEVTTFSNEKEQSCFAKAKDKESEVNTEYNNAWIVCTQSATDTKNAIAKEIENSRNDLIKQGKSVCSALTDCEPNTDGLKFLSCTTQASNMNYPQLFKISVKSASLEKSVQARYEQIHYTQSECTSLAFYKFVTVLSQVVKDRQECLKEASSSNSS